MKRDEVFDIGVLVIYNYGNNIGLVIAMKYINGVPEGTEQNRTDKAKQPRIRVRFAGRRDRLAKDLIEDMETMEEETKQGDALTLTICADYGGRDAIARAVQGGARTVRELDEALTAEIPTPDAILRTGGEMRLSNFLLWQAAYAELFFSPTMFPALEDSELDALSEEYSTRTRKFGV